MKRKALYTTAYVIAALIAGLIIGAILTSPARAASDNIPEALASHKAQLTWIGGQPLHYAAVTRQKGRIDWKRNAVILLTNGSKSVWVKQSDYCSGDACRDVDVSYLAFDELGNPSQGVMSVQWACGKHGQLPDSKCVR